MGMGLGMGGGWDGEGARRREGHLVYSLADPDRNAVEHFVVIGKCGGDEGVVERLGGRSPCFVVLLSREGWAKEGGEGKREMGRETERGQRSGSAM